jgi:hypothetical protein
MNDEKKIDKLLRTIRALRAKAEGTNNEAEAAAFAAKVAEMLAQYGLEESQLDVQEQSEIGHEYDVAKEWSTSPARRILANSVCRLYSVRCIMPGNKGGKWTIIGRKHNIVMAKEMMTYLVKTTVRLSGQWRKENFMPHSEAIDFRRGCFERLAQRLTDLRHEQHRRAAPVFNSSGNPQNLPALYMKESDLVNGYMKANFQFRSSKVKAGGRGVGAADGRRAADRVSLSPQVGGGSGGGFLLGRK